MPPIIVWVRRLNDEPRILGFAAYGRFSIFHVTGEARCWRLEYDPRNDPAGGMVLGRFRTLHAAKQRAEERERSRVRDSR